jgi:DNA modification methylase
MHGNMDGRMLGEQARSNMSDSMRNMRCGSAAQCEARCNNEKKMANNWAACEATCKEGEKMANNCGRQRGGMRRNMQGNMHYYTNGIPEHHHLRICQGTYGAVQHMRKL